MHDTREKLKAWQHDYNHHCPHGSLGPDPERVR
ncbi:TPA: integrase core domain-containing protein [Pseudomonas aeruginosa]